MKLSVTVGFIDKDTNIFHKVGEIVEYPEKRAKEIETRGFGKCMESKPTKTEKVVTNELEVERKPRQTREFEEPRRSRRR